MGSIPTTPTNLIMKLVDYPPPRKGMCYEFKRCRLKVTNVYESIVYYNVEYSSGDIAYGYFKGLDSFLSMVEKERRLYENV